MFTSREFEEEFERSRREFNREFKIVKIFFYRNVCYRMFNCYIDYTLQQFSR